jgi:hypothetical protein
MNRIRDTRASIYSFQDEFLVQCPHCTARATVFRFNPDNTKESAPWRFSCTTCSTSQDWVEKKSAQPWYGEPTDPYFHYLLWLKLLCCGHQLWAYNLRHLDFIEAFVKATHRERKPDERYGWSNASLFSRLPKWIQSRKNRDEILKAIAKIREVNGLRSR